MKRRTYDCAYCGESFTVWREDRDPAYCSQSCARKARAVPTKSSGSDRYVRVSVGTRDELKRMRPEATIGETVAYILGAFVGRVPTGIGERGVEAVESDTGRYDDTTKIRLDEGCHSALVDLRDRLEADSLGDTIATLLETTR